MLSYQLLIPEPASTHIESLLAQVCPVHITTTLDGGRCDMCAVEGERFVAETEATYARMAELEAEDGTRTETYIRLEEEAWASEETER